MDDAERRAVGTAAIVRVVQAGRGTGDDRERELERYALALAAGLGEQRAQILAMHVLHREVVDAAVLADLEHLRDVLVVQARGEARFIEEHLDRDVIVRALGQDDLEYDVSLEAADARRTCDIDPRHATCSERHHDLELPQATGESSCRGYGWHVVDRSIRASIVSIETLEVSRM